MKIAIVGGGNVGYYLVKTLIAQKHHVMMIEKDAKCCERIASEMGGKYVEVTHADGTDVACLREAGVAHAQVLIAVTGQDQNNFVACQFAKEYFGVPRTISRVNNPKNIRVFEKLGVDSVVSSTARIAGIINQELDWTDVNRLLRTRSESVRIREAAVEPESKFAGKRVMDLGLPKGMILLSVLRADEAIIPGGETQLLAGDSVIVMGRKEELPEVLGGFSEIGGK
ncbi:MAG: TrkA family potassium uptake protein [Clostridia bacterium]